jgi:deoxyribodipyrimidine photo-lyase
MTAVPPIRIRALNAKRANPDGEYVLYWMTSARRVRFNFALQRAVERARELGRPLLVLEPLRAGYPYASDRLHRFVLEGMRDNAAAFQGSSIFYYPYVEAALGEGRGLLHALSERACVVVTDDYPCFFLPRMLQAAASSLEVGLEAVDGNGLLPLAAAPTPFPTAYAFRRHLQKVLPEHLAAVPEADPLAGPPLGKTPPVPGGIASRWSKADLEVLLAPGGLAHLPIDHSVSPADLAGGQSAAEARLRGFLAAGLTRYAALRNDPAADAASRLSPYLHFGHVSAHEVFSAVADAESWDAGRLSQMAAGRREGWWGMSRAAEAFLDQLVTWRELGYVFCRRRTEDYARYESLPEWAQATLERHATDRREHLYPLERLAAPDTHDPLWNAAQNQLLREGRIHNYLRMLWGKKVLEWSVHPREALAVLLELNDRFALDGRDPNSCTGVLWCLGRHDRPWGPERPVFGTVRYMSSQNTARKFDVKPYLRKYGRGAE